MQYNIATTGDHVSLQIKEPDLPDDEQQREAILDHGALVQPELLLPDGYSPP